MMRSLRPWALTGWLCLLAACGGGGGGGSPTQQANHAPAARALASGDVRLANGALHATVGGSILLDASGSTDADNDALTYAWTLVSKPAGSNVTASGTSDTLRWKPDTLGVFTFDVRVTDPKGASSTQEVAVNVDNVAPAGSVAVTATFTASVVTAPPQTVTVGGNVVLDATKSTDPDGDSVTVTFELTGPAGSAAILAVADRVARFSPDMLGTYQVRARGTDAAGASFETLYVFQADNRAPTSVTDTSVEHVVADGGTTEVRSSVGYRVQIDSARSGDPDGNGISRTWSLSAKPAGSTADLQGAAGAVSMMLSPDVLGDYVVTLTVTDTQGAQSQRTVTVHADNRPPAPVTVANVQPVTGDAGSTVVTTAVGYDVLIDGSGSTDADHDAVTYAWSLSATPPGSTVSLQGSLDASSVGLSPDLLGDYVVVLKVTDSHGASSKRTVTVRADNRRPLAVVSTNATPQSLPAGPPAHVSLGTVVTLRADASTDADGDALTDAWSIDSAPAGSAATLSSTSASAPIFTADVEGRYVFRLRVTDTKGAYSERTVVLDVGGHPPVAVVDHTSVTVAAGASAGLSAALSFDEDGDALSFQWSIDAYPAGSSATLLTPGAAAVTFKPDVAGTYVLAARVSDGHTTSIAYVTVHVLAAFQSSVALGFVPGETRYSVGLDKVVIAATGPDALHVIDPFTGTQAAIALPMPVKNLSLSPDGRLAVVLHEGVASLVDLATATLIHSSSTYGSQSDAIVTNAGVIYAMGTPSGVTQNSIVVVDGRTGVRTPQSDVGWPNSLYFSEDPHGVLAQTQDKVFFMTTSGSQDIHWFTFNQASSKVTDVGTASWNGLDAELPIWLASDDSLIFTRMGAYFRADTFEYAGKLIGLGNRDIVGFSHSAALQEALVLSPTYDGSSYPYIRYPSSYLRYTGPLFFPDAPMALPTVGGLQAYGMRIFHSAAGSHVVLARLGNGDAATAAAGYAVIAR